MIYQLRKSYIFILIFTILSLHLVSCGTLATPYQPYKLDGVLLGGYQDELYPANQTGSENLKYKVSFVGNGGTSLEKAVKYWYQRADELCNKNYEVIYFGAHTAEGVIEFESYHLVGAALISIPGKAKSSSPNVNGYIECK